MSEPMQPVPLNGAAVTEADGSQDLEAIDFDALDTEAGDE